jgi:hypothetical protein
MMAVVKVLPQWAPRFGFTFSYCIWCAGSDDERPSLHHPFASAMSGVPFDCHEHQMPPLNAKPFAILVRPRIQGYKVLHSLPSSFTQPPGGILEAMRLAELPEAVSAPLEFAPRKHFFVPPRRLSRAEGAAIEWVRYCFILRWTHRVSSRRENSRPVVGVAQQKKAVSEEETATRSCPLPYPMTRHSRTVGKVRKVSRVGSPSRSAYHSLARSRASAFDTRVACETSTRS